jgi:hypothetical protein
MKNNKLKNIIMECIGEVMTEASSGLPTKKEFMKMSGTYDRCVNLSYKIQEIQKAINTVIEDKFMTKLDDAYENDNLEGAKGIESAMKEIHSELEKALKEIIKVTR